MEEIRRTLYRASRGEYTEKKSRFIADLIYTETEEGAEAFYARIRKEFYDARHHCTAMVLLPKGNPVPVLKSSDDGEPQGTAGHPMLDVLTGRGIVNCAACVTRYFGGTLLGTGGLVRSYTKALQDAVEKSIFIERRIGLPLRFELDYGLAGKFDYYAAKENITVTERIYGGNVGLRILVPKERADQVISYLTEMTGGKTVIGMGDPVEFASYDGKVLTGEDLVLR